jgi:CheY-like chemotaxis protein
MPVMNGVQFLEEMRRDPALADIPVVIATSAPHRAPSGTIVLTKPIDMKLLWQWMERACSCAADAPGPRLSRPS